MGRERTTVWQHIFLFSVCLSYFFCYGCATSKQGTKCEETSTQQEIPVHQSISRHKEISEHIMRSQELVAAGDFQGALGANQKILSMSAPDLPKDEALYNIALIYAHYNNPHRDYKKSILYLKKLLQEYPKSSFAEQAEVWSEVLLLFEKLNRLDIEIEEKIKQE